MALINVNLQWINAQSGSQGIDYPKKTFVQKQIITRAVSFASFPVELATSLYCILKLPFQVVGVVPRIAVNTVLWIQTKEPKLQDLRKQKIEELTVKAEDKPEESKHKFVKGTKYVIRKTVNDKEGKFQKFEFEEAKKDAQGKYPSHTEQMEIKRPRTEAEIKAAADDFIVEESQED